MEETKKSKIIDIREMAKDLWSKKYLFLKVWVVTFVLACIWILPQPRYYVSEVKLAPEANGDDVGGGLSSIASSFGFDLGGVGGQDAIYAELYPELFESPEFIVGLYNIQVTTKEGDLTTNYFTYMKEHQKKNPLTEPFNKLMRSIKGLFEEEDPTPRGSGASDINPFQMNRKDYMLMKSIMKRISCTVDDKYSLIMIRVKDQDPLISATMTDSVRCHLQDFIIRYRTSKVHEDLVHYQQMRDNAEAEYREAMNAYARFSDQHKNTILQSYQSEREKLESELAIKQTSLTAMETQLQATKVKIQEKTPSFTVIKSAIVPVKPAGPKRMLFVIFMLVLTTIATVTYVLRSYLLDLMVIRENKE